MEGLAGGGVVVCVVVMTGREERLPFAVVMRVTTLMHFEARVLALPDHRDKREAHLHRSLYAILTPAIPILTHLHSYKHKERCTRFGCV